MSPLPCTTKRSFSTAVRREFETSGCWSRRWRARETCLPSLPELAASYAKGIISNHPFVDGNKRTAFIVSVTFLRLNGVELTASQDDRIRAFLGLAAGEISEAQLAAWFERNTSPQ
jgi:prophage maintenance system killer protein